MKKSTNETEIEIPKLQTIYNTIVNTTILSVDAVKKGLEKIDKKKKRRSIIFITLLIILNISIIFFVYVAVPPKIISVKYSDEISENDTQKMIIKIKVNNRFTTKCKLNKNKWIISKNNTCVFDVSTGSNKIYIKNLFNTKELSELTNINGIKKIELDGEKIYLAVDETIKLNTKIDYVGKVDEKLKWISSNKDIVSVEDGTIKGLKVGESLITVTSKNNVSYTTKVIVTDLITPMTLNDKKSFLTCHKYSEEEASVLDDILKTRIELKGEGTRAALIETIRFITLSFKEKVPYFFENGRLVPYGKMHYVDGEGRYYHKGLYLAESKKEDIVASFVGPAIWGCPLTNFDDLYGWTVGAKYPNGLDCSGFVSWALYNSGIDVGDIGAGITAGKEDISDLGEMHKITYDFVNNKEFKVGDIIGWDGHIALIAGLDDENIYIAESLSKGVRIASFSYKKRNSGLYSSYQYINNMDDVYKSDGIYTDMW